MRRKYLKMQELLLLKTKRAFLFYSKKYGYVSVLFFSSSVGCAALKHESHQKNGEHTAILSPYAVVVAS